MFDWQSIYLSSQGRLARLPYFAYMVVLVVVYMIVVAILGAILGVAGLIIGAVLYLVLVFPFYNLMAKRLQDFGKPGKYAWGVIGIGVLGTALSLISVLTEATSLGSLGNLLSTLQLLLSLVILFLPGHSGENEYGPQPSGKVF